MNPDLELKSHFKAPRATVWRACSDPKHLAQWWAPKPWVTDLKAFDLRPGGAFHALMRGPNGDTSDNTGLFLDVAPQERVVFAITAIITLADANGGTDYTARVLHADKATRDKHDEMGFYDGWGTCVRQLAELAEGMG